jgi:hypothetical protein
MNRLEENGVMNTGPLEVQFLKAELMGEESKHSQAIQRSGGGRRSGGKTK